MACHVPGLSLSSLTSANAAGDVVPDSILTARDIGLGVEQSEEEPLLLGRISEEAVGNDGAMRPPGPTAVLGAEGTDAPLAAPMIGSSSRRGLIVSRSSLPNREVSISDTSRSSAASHHNLRQGSQARLLSPAISNASDVLHNNWVESLKSNHNPPRKRKSQQVVIIANGLKPQRERSRWQTVALNQSHSISLKTVLSRIRSKKPRGILRETTDFIAKEHDIQGQPRQRLVRFTRPKKEEEEARTVRFCCFRIPLPLPGTVAHQRWSHIMSLPRTYETWAIPFRMAVTDPSNTIQLAVDIVMDTWNTVDMILYFLTCRHLKRQQKKEQGKGTVANEQSPTRFWRPFAIYYLPPAALYITVLLDAPFWMWCVASLMRLPRVYLLYSYFSEMAMRLEVNAKKLQIYKFCIIIFLSIHWVGCLFFLISRFNGFDESTWVYRVTSASIPQYDPLNASTAEKYLLLMYKGGNHITNLGYDSSRPDNLTEMCLAIVVMFVQIFIAAYILGTLFHHLVGSDATLEDYRRKVAMLQQFMQDRQLPQHLRNRLLKYLEFSYAKSKDKYAASIDIPRRLELRIASCQFMASIDTCTSQGGILRGCNEQFMNALLLNISEMYLMPGEEFIRAGDIGRELGFVSAGILDVLHQEAHGEVVLRSINGDNLDMPTVIGEISFFINTIQPYKVMCRSTGDAAVLVISRDGYNTMLSNYPEQHDIISANILSVYGLDSQGRNLPGWSGGQEEDQDVTEVREMVLGAVLRQKDDLANQFTYAVSQGEVDLVKTLIRKGVDVNTANYDHSSMAHLAASTGNTKVLEVLLEEGAEKDIVDRWGHTPLHTAIVTGSSLAVSQLTKQGATLAVSDPASEMCSAASEEDITQLSRLVKNGVDPNLGDYDMRTAMHLAAATGAQKSIEFLLANGGDPNVMDRWGGLPLMDAVKEGHTMVTLILKRNGARLSANNDDEDGASADQLCEAAASGNVAMLQLLKDAGVNLNQHDYDSRCAMHLAAANGRLLAVSYLLSICAHANVKDRWGSTPIEDALRGGHLSCAKLIQANGGELGPSPSPEVQKQFSVLENVSIKETRECVAQALVKAKDKPAKETTKEEIHAGRLALVKSLEMVMQLNERHKSVSRKYRALRGNLRTVVYQIWAGVREMVAEGLAAQLSKDTEVGHRRNDWMAVYNALDKVIDEEQRRPLQHAQLSDKELELYLELENVVKAHNMDSDGEENSDADGGEDDEPTQPVMSPKDMAKNFQSQVVANLSSLQDGFDEFLDEFDKQSKSNPLLSSADLQALLEQLVGTAAPEVVRKVIKETSSPTGSEPQMLEDGSLSCLSCSALWSHSPTFWEVLKNTQWPDYKAFRRIGSTRRGSSILAGGSMPNHSAGHPTEEPSQVSSKLQMVVVAHEIVIAAFDLFATGLEGPNRTVRASTLTSVLKHLGEFGAPLFHKIFDSALENGRGLCMPEFISCFVEYLDSSAAGDGPQEELEVYGSECTDVEVEPGLAMVLVDKAVALVDEAWESAFKVVRRLSKLVKVPIGRRALQQKLQSRRLLRRFQPCFEVVTGALDKPLRRQNVRAFVAELLPRYAIREAHADDFVREVTTQPDGLITWEQLQAWLVAKSQDPEDGTLDETGSVAAWDQPIWGQRSVSQRLVMKPTNTFLRLWEVVILPMAVYEFLVVPVQICSEEVQHSKAIEAANWVGLRYRGHAKVVEGLFMLDICLRFFKAYYDRHSILVTDLKKIYQHYTSGSLLFDLFIAMPLSIMAINASSQTKAWLRLPKILRLHLIYNYWKKAETRMDGSNFFFSCMRLVSLTLVVTHIATCIYFYLGTISSGSWILRGEAYGNQEGDGVMDHYILAFYFVIATLSTNGVVGELTPETYPEVLFVILLMLINITLFAYVLGQISSLVMKADDEVAEARSKQAQVDNFIKAKKGLTVELAADIRSHANEVSMQGKDVDIGEIYELMSHSLQVAVAECISRDMLDQIPLFQGCSRVFLDSLSVLMREARFNKDELIFRQNEVSKELCYVINGSVERLIEVENEEPLHDGKSSNGDCLGELSFFFGMRQIYTAKALEPTTSFLLERTLFQQLLRMFPNAEETIASNALQTHEKAWSRAGSQCASAKSGTSAKSVQETMEAVVGGNLKQTISVLRRRRNLEAVEGGMKLAARGDIEALKKLFASGINVNATNHDNRCCLHVAACHGQVETVKFLLDEMGADFSIVDTHGNVPLNDAVRHQQDEVASILREWGACVKMDTCDAACILCQAAFDNDLATLKRYVENGVNAGAGDYDLRTALHLAASEGRVEIVDYLLTQAIDFNAKDRMGCTPLEDAIRHGHRDVQKLLRSAGAVLQSHAVVLCDLAAKGDLEEMKVLLENGVDPNDGDYDGRTCMHLAACENQLSVIHFLLTCHESSSGSCYKKVEINPVDNMGGTPLDDAIRQGHSVVEMLLRLNGGICQEDTERIAFAKETQANRNRNIFTRQVETSAKGMVVSCREARYVSTVNHHIERLGSYMQTVSNQITGLAAELQLFVVEEKDFAVKKRRARSYDKAKRHARAEEIQKAVCDVIPALLEWKDQIENDTETYPAAIRTLVRHSVSATDNDDNAINQQQRRMTIGGTMLDGPVCEMLDPRHCKEACLKEIDVLWEALNFVSDMLPCAE